MPGTPSKNTSVASERPAPADEESRSIVVSLTGNAIMHFFDFTSPSAPGRLVRLAVCTLLPAFIPEAVALSLQRSATTGRPSAAHVPPSAPAPAPRSKPYLLVCLPLSLRFAEPVEPSDPVVDPVSVLGPPHPGGLLEEIAALNQQAAMSPSPSATASLPSLTPAASTANTEPSESSGTASSPSLPTASPQIGVAILPDDTPRNIRPEDVLIYFQFPAASPATPSSLPRSSATYKQQ
jgi:hypothetical protein